MIVDFSEDLSEPVALADSANTRITPGSSDNRLDLRTPPLQCNSEPSSVETCFMSAGDVAKWRRKRPNEDNVGE